MTRSGNLTPPTIHVVLLLLLGVATASGTPLFYTFNFTGGPTLPTAGGFSYDPATTTFISFNATWDGLFFDFTSQANNTNTISNLDCASNKGPAAVFDILLGQCTSRPGPYEWHAEFDPSGIVANFSFDNALTNPSAGLTISLPVPSANTSNSNGGYIGVSTSTVSTPEPDGLILTIAGGAILFAARRRLTRV